MAKMVILLAGIALLMPGPDLLTAQTQSDSSLTSVLQTAKTRRWILRVTTDTTVHHEGMLTKVSQDSFSVGSREFSFADGLMIERRALDRSNIRAAVLAGMFTGLAAGALRVTWRCMETSSSNCPNDWDYALVFGTTFTGTFLGALFGGLFGGYEWVPVWPN